MHPLFKHHIHAEHPFTCVGYKGYVHLEPVAYSNRQRLFESLYLSEISTISDNDVAYLKVLTQNLKHLQH